MLRFIKLLLLTGLTAAVAFLIPASIASAADAPTVPEHATGTLIVVSTPLITFIVGSVIPLVTALLTRLQDSSTVKYVITVVLNAVTALLTTGLAEDGTKILSTQTAMTWIFGVLISLASYRGWKAGGLTSSAVVLPDPQVEGQTVSVPGKLSAVGRS